jgi:hypothetical protein
MLVNIVHKSTYLSYSFMNVVSHTYINIVVSHTYINVVSHSYINVVSHTYTTYVDQLSCNTFAVDTFSFPWQYIFG